MSKNTAGYFYEAPKIHRLFGLSSLALLGSTLWMVWQDHHREWKGWQLQARAAELKRLREERDWRRGRVDQAALVQALGELSAASKDLQGRDRELEALQGECQARNRDWYKSDQDYRAAKAEVDAARYRFEEAGHHGRDASKAEAEYRAWQKTLEELRSVQEKALASLEDAKARASALTAGRDGAKAKAEGLEAQVARLEKRIQAIGPSLGNDYFRDQPGVDYMIPTLKVQSITPPGLTDDYNFVKVQKVDRCTTCHVNADRAGFEGEAQPLASHPRLDLFLGGRSSHPMETFGCTTCHGGQGGATDFLHAYHTPRDEKQALEWEEKYGWLSFQAEHAPLWSFPMSPKAHVEASCRKCHAGRVELDAAPSYSRGKRIFEGAGCWGCHKVAGFEPRSDPKEGRVPGAAEADRLPKPGPDLDDVGCKLSPEFTAKWLSDPKRFREHTRMPSFFGVSPDMTPEMRRREAAEIRAITAFLHHASASTQFPEGRTGDAAKGKALVETVGCLACHTIGGEGGGRKADLSDRHADFDAFAPDLGRIGSKVNSGWLVEWLKDPKHYFPNGRMPDLRLTDAEAADAAAYLMTLRDEAFEKAPAPAEDRDLMKAILEEKIRGKETQAVVDYVLHGGPLPAELARLPEDQRPARVPEDGVPVELGKQTIRRYGCYGCHVIPGFADDKGIGAELTEVGSKDLGQVDFGFVGEFQARTHFSENALRTRHAWLKRKVTEPRVFDEGRDKAPFDRLIMPQFGFRDADVRDLTTFLLSLSKEKAPLHRQEAMTADRIALERGRRLVQDSNCAACHVVGGSVRTVDAAGLKADERAWLAEHVLLAPNGELARASGAQDALERRQREKASEREVPVAAARTFLAQRPQVPEALAKRLPAGVPASPRTSELLGSLDAARREPFKPFVPGFFKVSGLGEGVPGRVIADRATGTPQAESGKFAPPFLMDLGERVRPEWLHRFLLDPSWEYAKRGGQPIRPKVPLRMPTFGFTEAQAADLVRFFCATAEASYPYVSDPEPAPSAEARKAALFMLKDKDFQMDCISCHVVDGQVNGEAVGPDLDHVAGRLRRDWMRRLIQDATASQPNVVMPKHFEPRPDGGLTEYYSPEDLGEDFPEALKALKGNPGAQLEAVLDYLLLPAPERARPPGK